MEPGTVVTYGDAVPRTTPRREGSPAVEAELALSFDSFYRSELQRVVAVVYALTGSRPAAEDLAHDAFIKAHKRWEEVSTYDRPGAWVRKVATNLALSRFRRLSAERRALARLGPSPELTFDLDPADAEFWQAVRGLPKRQAQVVALFYLEDRTVREVSDILDIAEGTVRTQLHRGRKALAHKLGADLGEEVTP
ncbi:MAG: hypothetical protein JJLCMIEE_00721 [Acidimicrobiales bacterium]|nr:MAG: SigE family RNA polymerase sigma factor [Actinomycetota bacterium]MBV6507666.1 hypothetical protein [Acidimicrobiales bacterium]RIK07596.1 MAG: SigE family RNA polymerase sigma factor [Acidobacteriota bacterium]